MCNMVEQQIESLIDTTAKVMVELLDLYKAEEEKGNGEGFIQSLKDTLAELSSEKC